jgi:energy-coupling factor transporter ATP-binding protein EcfA2
MIKSTFGVTREPFYRSDVALLAQQAEAMEMIRIHAQHGGFSVIVGNPGVGKSVLREHIEKLGTERDTVVVSFSQTMHTYQPILRQLAASLQLSARQGDRKRPAVPPSNAAYACVEFANGSSESSLLLGELGSLSRVSANQRAGSSPLSLAVANRLWMAAARRPARSEPANSQFFLPIAIGRIVFSTGLLSIGRLPESA